MTALLEVQDLGVSYRARAGQSCPALVGVTFAVQPGETLGVLGESGSGKSTLAAALLRILPANGAIRTGSIRLENRELLQLSARDMEEVRGGQMALIFQEPSLALHPAIRVSVQIEDVLAAHQWVSRRERKERVHQVLAAVFSADAERIAQTYPHQLSGGQRARVLIAQAISCGPSLIVADEPTASLDPETQREILSLFRRLKDKFKLSSIWITHNPALLEGFADRVAVLYAGRLVEIGPAHRVLGAPQHPYTQALLRCLPPELGQGFARHKQPLPVISGDAPLALGEAKRCLFESRCGERIEICATREPHLVELIGSHQVSCFKREG